MVRAVIGALGYCIHRRRTASATVPPPTPRRVHVAHTPGNAWEGLPRSEDDIPCSARSTMGYLWMGLVAGMSSKVPSGCLCFRTTYFSPKGSLSLTLYCESTRCAEGQGKGRGFAG